MIEKKLGLYIHIPFCKYICDYCDFCKKDVQKFDTSKYINYLIKDLQKYKGVFQNIDTIYIGGGTPSSIAIEDLQKLFNYLNKNINMKQIKEYTLEANPDDINEQLVQCVYENNVNRISLGVQTLNDTILKKINRLHTSKDVINAINIISKKIDNINIDLIFNLPDQKLEDIKDSIQIIKLNKLKIQHVSYYSLILEEHTKLYNQKYEGLEEEQEDEIYKYIQEQLKLLDYKQYEISNFSKLGKESIHNKKYWKQEEYIGVGLGASGYINNKRYTITRSLDKYYKSIENSNNDCITEEELLTREDKLQESIFLGLRMLQGIPYKIIEDNEVNIEQKYFDIKNDKISIKKEYLFLSNNIILDILEQLDR